MASTPWCHCHQHPQPQSWQPSSICSPSQRWSWCIVSHQSNMHVAYTHPDTDISLSAGRQETNPKLITNNMKKVLRIHSSNLSHTNVTQYIEGILSKGPYLPCLRMADRALLAGYPGYLMVNLYVSQYLCTQIRTVYLYRSVFTAHYISTGLIPITPWPLSVAFEVWCEYMSDLQPEALSHGLE